MFGHYDAINILSFKQNVNSDGCNKVSVNNVFAFIMRVK